MVESLHRYMVAWSQRASGILPEDERGYRLLRPKAFKRELRLVEVPSNPR